MRGSPAVRITLHIAANLLNQSEGFLVNNRLLRTGEHRPLIHRNIVTLLVLEVLPGLEIHGFAQVLTLLQDTYHGGRSPIIGIRNLINPALPQTVAQTRHMDSGNLNLVLSKKLTDLIGAVPVNGHLKDPAHNISGFFVNDPMVMIQRVFQVAVGRSAGNMLTSLALGCEGGANLFARILRVPLVHNVTERDEVIITILTIHIVIDGDQAYTFLTKHLHDFANLEVVTTDSAHILDADRVDVTGIDLAHHGHEARTIKAGT